jgi:hypothetical protein
MACDGTGRAAGAPEIEERVRLMNRRDTTYYYGNCLNIYRASQSVIVRSVYDRGGKRLFATRHSFLPGTRVRVIGDARGQTYEIGRFAGFHEGRAFGKIYEVRKCDGAWNLDDYAALKAGRTVWEI